MMHEHIMGPFWGVVAVVGIGGAVTVACFVAMFWMLFRPGEDDLNHVKRQILSKER